MSDDATYPRVWYHLNGTQCNAGWWDSGDHVGECGSGGGPVTASPRIAEVLAEALRVGLNELVVNAPHREPRYFIERCEDRP